MYSFLREQSHAKWIKATFTDHAKNKSIQKISVNSVKVLILYVFYVPFFIGI